MAFTEFKPSIATWLQGALFLLTLVTQVLAVESAAEGGSARSQKITPKIFIFSMFEPEGEVWWNIPEFNLLANNITVPGLSPIYPDVHCTASHEICHAIIGEAEINAASTVSAIALSDLFDLGKTYFLIAGIAGINPEVATTGSVTFARYAVQVALQYEIDPRELPQNWTTGYFPLGTHLPTQYPESIYGTEVFELNADLRSRAVAFARKATLNDSAAAAAYRANYKTPSGIYTAGASPPSVVECDVATSDVYYSGTLLSVYFGETVHRWTNGTGLYCSTAQEENGSLEALLRAALHQRVDFSRVIVMRTASDFDREYPGEDPVYHLVYADQAGFEPSIQNIYLAGVKVVEGILNDWDAIYKKGIKPTNYIGDIFGTLGGTPDFGPGRQGALADAGVSTKRKRGMGAGLAKRRVVYT